MTCVFDCVHPLWGGHGVCEAETGCVCDVGYTNRDSMGNSSCVPRSVQLAGYITLTVVGMGSTIFLGYTCGCAVVFLVAVSFGANLPLWGYGVCEIFYTMFYPSRALAIAMVAALWVNSLPSQVLPPTSFTMRLKEYCETRHVFGRLGLVGMLLMIAFGIFSWFEPNEAMTLADLVSACGESLVGLCIIFVGMHTCVAIDHRQAQQSSDASRAFYGRAKRALILQMLALGVAAFVYLVATWVIHYTVFGKYTPIIPLVVRFLDGNLGLCAAVHLARPDRSTEAKRRAGPHSAGSDTSSAEPLSFPSRAMRYLPNIRAVSFWRKKLAADRASNNARVGTVALNVVVPTKEERCRPEGGISIAEVERCRPDGTSVA